MNIGIKIYGILAVLFSLLIIYIVVIPDFIYRLDSYMFTLAYLITAICWLVFGIGVLKRVNWARIGLIVVSGIYAVDTIEYPSHLIATIKRYGSEALALLIIAIIFFVSLIVYFTRPRIKKHFDQNAK
jgi:hypothetical protein